MLAQKEITDRYAGIQDIMSKVDWRQSCLFLTLCSMIESINGSRADILGITRKALDAGIIDRDFFVKDSTKLLQEFTGKRFVREIYSPDEMQKVLDAGLPDDWYTIEHWTRETKEHFRRRFVDTVKNSLTITYGSLKDYYVYKQV